MELLIPILLFIFFISTIVYFRTPAGRGVWGEYRVKRALGKTVFDKKYVIHNLLIVNEGKSSQIDHIMINPYGIFVIETKNLSGRIFGAEHQREWTQVLNYGKLKRKFYNPIMQNRTHIYALIKVLGRSDGFFSIVVFPKADIVTHISPGVGNLSTMKNIVRNQTRIILDNQTMKKIYDQLMIIRNDPKMTTKQHVDSIKKTRLNIQNNICPRCGKALVMKNGKYGQFYGCSNYPKCQFRKSSTLT